MKRNNYMKKSIKIITILLLIYNSASCLAQNVKKTFKYIKSDDIEQAYKEISKIDENSKKMSSDEAEEFNLAIILVFSNEKMDEFDPFSTLQDFKKLAISDDDRPKVIEFLKKFDYDFDIIQDIIFQSIVKVSKKENTELAYEKALSVCNPCNYKKELATLKELAAYKESKIAGTIAAYEYFLNEYDNSNYKEEIYQLLENKAFEEAKSIKSINSINGFISKYPKSKFKGEALDMRDSLALPNEPMSFDSVSEYIKTYPNSKFTTKLKLDLPDILYKEVVSENTIEIIKKFIDLYPNDERVGNLKSLLEISYVDILKEEFNIEDYNYFKNTFPNSQYLKELNKLFSEKKKNNDLVRLDLKGEIKSIQTLVEGGNEGSVVALFDSFGKIESINVGRYIDIDELENFELVNDPKVFDKEFNFFTLLGHKKESIYCEYKGPRGWISPTGNVSYHYDKQGNTISIDGTLDGATEFIYDEKKKLTTTKTNYIIKYKWNNNKLISKNVFHEDGKYVECYNIEYTVNSQIINRYCSEGDSSSNIEAPTQTYVITFDKNVQVLTKTKSYTSYNAIGKDTNINYINKYYYTNNYLTTIVRDYHDEGAITWGRIGKFLNENSETQIKRDSYGNILNILYTRNGRIDNSKTHEYSYEYDKFGNWIKRVEFEIKNGDIVIRKKIKEVSRIINYY